MKHAYTIHYSEEDKEWTAISIEFPYIVGMGPTEDDAIREMEIVIDAWISATDDA